MAKNQFLYDSGVKILETLVKRFDPQQVSLQVDTEQRLRMQIGGNILYFAYDFVKGPEFKREFREILKTAKKMGNLGHGPKVLASGLLRQSLDDTLENSQGAWYVALL